MSKSYLPGSEADLIGFAKALDQVIAVNPVAYGINDTQSGALHDAALEFEAAWQTVQVPGTRSPGNIEVKNTAKKALISLIRTLVKIAQASPVMTDDKRAAMGITIPDTDPTPVPVPEASPQLDVVSVSGRTVKVRLRNSQTGDRRKPAGVQGAAMLSYVGPTVPEDMRQWFFEGNTTRLDTEVGFDATVPTGSRVWLTAFWFNQRGESGPACAPVSTHVGFGVLAEGPGTAQDEGQAEAA